MDFRENYRGPSFSSRIKETYEEKLKKFETMDFKNKDSVNKELEKIEEDMEKFVEEMVNEQIIPVLDLTFPKELRKKFLEPIDFWNILEKYKRRNFFDEIMKDSNRSFDEQIKIIDNYVKIEKVDEIMKDSNLSLDEKIKIIDNESRLIKEFNDTLEQKIKENNEKYKNKYLSYEEVPLDEDKNTAIDNIKKTYEEKLRNFFKK